MPTMGDLEPGPRRRFYLGMAVDRYRDLPDDGGLIRPSADAERLAGLLAPAGYQQALPGMGNYWTADHVRSTLSGWSKDVDLGPDDVVIFYFAGHGMAADRDRHYLMCWNSETDDPAATALATEDLVRILTRSGLRNLLMVLDTCYGGTAAADGAQVALRTIARQFTGTGSSGVWLLSSARAKDEAIDGAFIDALVPALREVSARTGQRQRHLDLVHVVDAVNHQFHRSGLRQRAELAAGMVTGLAPSWITRATATTSPPGTWIWNSNGCSASATYTTISDPDPEVSSSTRNPVSTFTGENACSMSSSPG